MEKVNILLPANVRDQWLVFLERLDWHTNNYLNILKYLLCSNILQCETK